MSFLRQCRYFELKSRWKTGLQLSRKWMRLVVKRVVPERILGGWKKRVHRGRQWNKSTVLRVVVDLFIYLNQTHMVKIKDHVRAEPWVYHTHRYVASTLKHGNNETIRGLNQSRTDQWIANQDDTQDERAKCSSVHDTLLSTVSQSLLSV